MRIDRMLSITVMLLNRERVAARELAQRFEVSVRTIYRDIEAINLAGIPIVSYPGNNGGYGIMENYKIDRQVLTLKDMIAIVSSLKGINTALEDQELDSAIEKIRSLVPKNKTDQLELHLEQMVIDILPWGYPKRHKERLKMIYESIVHNRLLHFVYRNSKGEKRSRTVEPMTLVFKGYTWYLFAYCCMREDYRLFRLSRMNNLKSQDQFFARRRGSYRDFMEPDERKLNMAHLVLRFSPRARVRVEDYFDEEQISIRRDGSLIVKVSFPEDEWVYSFILSYGEDVEVVEPLHIRKIVKEKAKKITSLYQT